MNTVGQHLKTLAEIGAINLLTFVKSLRELDFINKQLIDLSKEEKKIVTDIILSDKQTPHLAH